MNIPNWSDLGNDPMTKREQIAALMMHAQFSRPLSERLPSLAMDAQHAVHAADTLIAELKRRKEQP